jgi:hypothetical protein
MDLSISTISSSSLTSARKLDDVSNYPAQKPPFPADDDARTSPRRPSLPSHLAVCLSNASLFERASANGNFIPGEGEARGEGGREGEWRGGTEGRIRETRNSRVARILDARRSKGTSLRKIREVKCGRYRDVTFVVTFINFEVAVSEEFRPRCTKLGRNQLSRAYVPPAPNDRL